MRSTDSMDTDVAGSPALAAPMSSNVRYRAPRHERAFATDARRYTGSEVPVLCHRLRAVDRRTDPRGHQPPAIPFAPLSVGRGSVPGRPISGTFRADRDSAIPSTGPACADMRSSHSEIAYPNGTIPFAVQVPRHDYPRLRSCRSGNAPAPLTDRSGSQIYPRWNRGKPRESAPRLGGDHCHSAGTVNIVSPRHEYHHSQQPTTALPVHSPPPSVRGNRS